MTSTKPTRKHKLEEAESLVCSKITSFDISSSDFNEAGPSNLAKKPKTGEEALELNKVADRPMENCGIAKREDIQDTMVAFPSEVSIMKFVEARVSEIALLTEAVKRKAPKQVCQQLPNHMRRRAASHNPNRLPHRLRRKGMKELQKVKVTKRPSRKYRRRPGNLMHEYNRRQRKIAWLETHIWFAKRFKMAEEWGYRLPVHPTDKSERASYRAATKYAVMQDVSYYGCIELTGTEEILLQHLDELTNSETGLTFQAKLYLDGTREGTTMLYHQKSYPYGFIGPVKFLWKTQVQNVTEDNNKVRQLWIWVHPSCFGEVVDELIDIFKLDKIKGAGYYLPSDCAASDVRIEPDNNSPSLESALDKKRNIYFERISSYTGKGVSMVLLKDVLVRHRLIGPQALSIIGNAIKLFCFDDLAMKQKSDKAECKWWKKVCTTDVQDLLQKKINMWKSLQKENSPSCVPSGTVIGLTVLDPRLRLPSKKSIVKDTCQGTGNSDSTDCRNLIPSPELAHSFIWNCVIRDEVTFTKIPEGTLNKMRSANVVPGTPLELGDEESRIPILIIQQPGNKDGFGSGWDIITPAGWSMAFWVALVYRGARTCGIRFSRDIGIEAKLPVFPYNFPDSQAGKATSEKQRIEHITKYYRYPPDKRPSFKKLGIVAPFFNPWFELVSEWKQYGDKDLLRYSTAEMNDRERSDMCNDNCKQNFFVIRNKCCLRAVANIIQAQTKDKLDALVNVSLKKLCWNLSDSLICIRLQCLFKGSLDEFFSICLPLEDDLKLLKENPHFGGPIEPVHKFKKEVKDKKKKKKKSKKSAEKRDQEEQDNKKLERPEIINLLKSTSRKIFGYVESGRFSFHCGCSCAIGHCSFIGLLEAIRLSSHYANEPVVLIRKHNSFQYRFCKIEIVI